MNLSNDDGGNNKNRTHQSVSLEIFGFEGKIGILIDNKTGDLGVVKCRSTSESLGATVAVVEWDMESEGAVTETSRTYTEGSVDATGLFGVGGRYSYSLKTGDSEITTLGNTKGVAGVALEVSAGLSVCTEVNVSKIFREAERVLKEMVDYFEGKSSTDKDSDVEKTGLEPTRTNDTRYRVLDPEKYDYAKALRDSRDSLNGGRERDVGGLSERSLGERPEHEHGRF